MFDMKPAIFALAAFASLAALPASAAVVVASLDATAMNLFSLNTVAIDPISLGVGDTLDLTINFTNGPMVVGDGSALWIGLLTNGASGGVTTTATMFVLGGSANMAASFGTTQLNNFVHVGNYFNAGQFQTAPGDMSFAGLRQTMVFDSDNIGSPRLYDRAFFYFEQLPAGIPEPQSWAMLIAGFGLVGAAARRRRVTAAA